MKFNTVEEFKKCSLVQICLTLLGYKVVQKKDSRYWRCLEAPNGIKILIKDQPRPNGDYLFMCANSDIKGNIINLLKEIHGYTMKQIYDEFLRKDLNFKPQKFANFCENEVKDNTDKIREIHNDFLKECTEQNYLTNRGVSGEVLKKFGVKASPNIAFFPLYMLIQNRWVVSTGIMYLINRHGDREQKFLKGCRKGGAVNLLIPQKRLLDCFKSIKIFESPIDALSYAQLFPGRHEAIYLSFCGGFGASFLKQLKLIIGRLKIESLNICVDNDDSGHRFADKIKRVIKGVDIVSHFPNLKDWNDDLQHVLNSQVFA